MRSIRRPSAPLVISVIALFAALGGTSYAAAKIKGKDIAKKTITHKNIKDETLGPKKLKPNALTGDQIDEATLGPVPSADNLDGLDSTAFMRSGQRLFEANEGNTFNFASGVMLGKLPSLPAGTHLVTSRFSYDNDGAVGAEICTLHLPGTNDIYELEPSNAQTVVLQKVVANAAPFDAWVSCTSDGDDDVLSVSIVSTRMD